MTPLLRHCGVRLAAAADADASATDARANASECVSARVRGHASVCADDARVSAQRADADANADACCCARETVQRRLDSKAHVEARVDPATEYDCAATAGGATCEPRMSAVARLEWKAIAWTGDADVASQARSDPERLSDAEAAVGAAMTQQVAHCSAANVTAIAKAAAAHRDAQSVALVARVVANSIAVLVVPVLIVAIVAFQSLLSNAHRIRVAIDIATPLAIHTMRVLVALRLATVDVRTVPNSHSAHR